MTWEPLRRGGRPIPRWSAAIGGARRRRGPASPTGPRLTLKIRWNYAQTLCYDPSSTLDELHEAVSTLEDSERIARRVFGGAHPLTVDIERELGKERALRARETKK